MAATKTEQKKETRGVKPGTQNRMIGDKPMTAGYSGRCLAEEKAAWVKSAQAADMKLNEWIRTTLTAAAEASAKAAKKN